MIQFIVKLIHSLLDNGRVGKDRLRGIVVSVGGILDLPQRKVIRFVNAPAMHDLDLGTPLELEFGVPIRLVGSQMASVVEEYERARDNGESLDYLTVTCGYGVAIFPLIEYRSSGFRPHAGKIDFGHIAYDLKGPMCSCGSRGCIEAYVGGWAIARDAMQDPSDMLLDLVDRAPERVNAKEVFDAAIRGDRSCMAIVRRAGSILGEMLCTFVQYHLPQRVVFMGGLVSGSTIYFDAAIESLRARMPAERFDTFQFQLSSLDKFAPAIGATRLLAHDVLHAQQSEVMRMLA
jgi:predicted NBD/HSP70 family sugar kinase